MQKCCRMPGFVTSKCLFNPRTKTLPYLSAVPTSRSLNNTRLFIPSEKVKNRINTTATECARFITLKKNIAKNKNLIYTVSYFTAVIFSAISLVSHNRSLFDLVQPESSSVGRVQHRNVPLQEELSGSLSGSLQNVSLPLWRSPPCHLNFEHVQKDLGRRISFTIVPKHLQVS